MTAFMGKDIVCGVKMITLSGKLRHNVAQRIRFFVGGTFLSCISIVSRHGGQCGFWISVSNTVDQYMFYVSTIYNISSKLAQVLEFSVGFLSAHISDCFASRDDKHRAHIQCSHQ